MRLDNTTILRMYVVAYWNKDNGWSTEIFAGRANASLCKDHNDFVGMTEIDCFLPKTIIEDEE